MEIEINAERDFRVIRRGPVVKITFSKKKDPEMVTFIVS